MRTKTLRFTTGFRPAFANARGQAAEMVIPPGDKEGGPDNAHHGADQWMLVIEGEGVAIVEGRRRTLKQGTLMLIGKGEKHEIRNTGRRNLRRFSSTRRRRTSLPELACLGLSPRHLHRTTCFSTDSAASSQLRSPISGEVR